MEADSEQDADEDPIRQKARAQVAQALAAALKDENAAVREHGLTYSRFIDGLGKAGIEVDRKMLSEMAIHEPAAFAAYVERARASLPEASAA